MFGHVHHIHAHLPAICRNCAPLRRFVGENRDALLNAACLLGGPRGVSIANAVLDGLAAEIGSPRRLRRDLEKLLGILMLENAHDENRMEAALAVAIDPNDPVVDALCRLADGLEAAIAEWDTRHAQADDLALEESAA